VQGKKKGQERFAVNDLLAIIGEEGKVNVQANCRRRKKLKESLLPLLKEQTPESTASKAAPAARK